MNCSGLVPYNHLLLVGVEAGAGYWCIGLEDSLRRWKIKSLFLSIVEYTWQERFRILRSHILAVQSSPPVNIHLPSACSLEMVNSPVCLNIWQHLKSNCHHVFANALKVDNRREIARCEIEHPEQHGIYPFHSKQISDDGLLPIDQIKYSKLTVFISHQVMVLI